MDNLFNFVFNWRMILRTKGTICKTILGFLFVISVRQFYLAYDEIYQSGEYPIIIWWTPHFPSYSSAIERCQNHAICEFTNDSNKQFHENTEGFIFYGSDFNYLDLPLPRDPQRYVWGLLHEESPRNTPIIQHEPTLGLFNYTSTISRHSNIPLTLLYLNSLQDLLTREFIVPTSNKNALLKSIAPVLYIQSDCETSSYRDIYVKELMNHIPVDSYGFCLNNKNLPDEFKDDYLNNLNTNNFLNFVAQYKFTISFENAICEDYITEKLWRPLKVGSVPIYMGSPSIRDWLPNDKSAIMTDDFQTPKQLAEFLHSLNNNDVEYEMYLQHKLINKITNDNLMTALGKKNVIENDGLSFNAVITDFQCLICEKIYERRKSKHFRYSVADQSHYNCPIPRPPSSLHSTDLWWAQQWKTDGAKAAHLNKLIIQENRKEIFESNFIQFD